MNISNLLEQMGGVHALASQLGISDNTARQGAEALLPAILGGMKKQAQSQPQGIAGLGSLLGKVGGSGLLGQVLGGGTADTSAGNDILGQLFGSKDVSRTVAENAAASSGLDTGLLKQMLPLLATMVTTYIGKLGAGTQQGGGLGSLVGGLLGAGKQQNSSGLASLLDLNGDGNPLDDILRLASKARR